MKKFILTAAAGLNLWILASWVNTILVNCDPGGIKAAWNLFAIIF